MTPSGIGLALACCGTGVDAILLARSALVLEVDDLREVAAFVFRLIRNMVVLILHTNRLTLIGVCWSWRGVGD